MQGMEGAHETLFKYERELTFSQNAQSFINFYAFSTFSLSSYGIYLSVINYIYILDDQIPSLKFLLLKVIQVIQNALQ
jgi:hypothetical protein